ncbi:MAG: c-type cytochrome [Gemmatimonadaceae bacterium]
MRHSLLTARSFLAILTVLGPGCLGAQVAGKFPPDSLVNVQIIPRTTDVSTVIGMMRNYAGWLGVRCQFCHVGEEGRPLDSFNFSSDEKRTKLVARQMMRLVAEINARLDTLPGRANPGLNVSCMTCHRGVSRPVPLSSLVAEMATTAGADSAIRGYRALRAKYYGGDSYDFRESSLNIAAFRLGRAAKFNEALALLDLNETLFPGSSGMYVFRGNINVMKADTAAAAAAFREAIRRDPANEEAKGRLQSIGQKP